MTFWSICGVKGVGELTLDNKDFFFLSQPTDLSLSKSVVKRSVKGRPEGTTSVSELALDTSERRIPLIMVGREKKSLY